MKYLHIPGSLEPTRTMKLEDIHALVQQQKDKHERPTVKMPAVQVDQLKTSVE